MEYFRGYWSFIRHKVTQHEVVQNMDLLAPVVAFIRGFENDYQQDHFPPGLFFCPDNIVYSGADIAWRIIDSWDLSIPEETSSFIDTVCCVVFFNHNDP